MIKSILLTSPAQGRTAFPLGKAGHGAVCTAARRNPAAWRVHKVPLLAPKGKGEMKACHIALGAALRSYEHDLLWDFSYLFGILRAKENTIALMFLHRMTPTCPGSGETKLCLSH